MEEVWKPVKGFEGLYEISSYGRVKSLVVWCGNATIDQYKKREYILKPILGTNGYYYVNLCKDKKRYIRRPHRLVAEAFLDNPNNYYAVNHIDGNKINNRAQNLEWCSLKQNNQHAFRTGLMDRLKKPVEKIDKNGNVICSYDSESDAARIEQIDVRNISACITGKRKTAGGFYWRLKDEKV